jgi:hypothetical protein
VRRCGPVRMNGCTAWHRPFPQGGLHDALGFSARSWRIGSDALMLDF